MSMLTWTFFESCEWNLVSSNDIVLKLLFTVRWERTQGSVCREAGKKMTPEDGEGYLINSLRFTNSGTKITYIS